jgi:hypothetical protein
MKVLILIVVIVSLGLLSSCATPPDVVQGTVASCGQANRMLAIHDAEKPGTTLEFSLAEADVGADPIPGDTVRIAYYTKGDKLMATRVMNISRQKELKAAK